MKLYTTDDVAEKMGVKVRTVRGWIQSGKLKAFKVKNTRRNYVTEEELQKFIGGGYHGKL